MKKRKKSTFCKLFIMTLIMLSTLLANYYSNEETKCYNEKLIEMSNTTIQILDSQLDLFKATWCKLDSSKKSDESYKSFETYFSRADSDINYLTKDMKFDCSRESWYSKIFFLITFFLIMINISFIIKTTDKNSKD